MQITTSNNKSLITQSLNRDTQKQDGWTVGPFSQQRFFSGEQSSLWEVNVLAFSLLIIGFGVNLLLYFCDLRLIVKISEYVLQTAGKVKKEGGFFSCWNRFYIVPNFPLDFSSRIRVSTSSCATYSNTATTQQLQWSDEAAFIFSVESVWTPLVSTWEMSVCVCVFHPSRCVYVQ